MARDIKGKLFIHNGERKINLEEGQTFRTVDEFRSVLKDFAIQECFYMDKKKNDKDRVTAIYGVSNTCTWRIHVSVLVDGHSLL